MISRRKLIVVFMFTAIVQFLVVGAIVAYAHFWIAFAQLDVVSDLLRSGALTTGEENLEYDPFVMERDRFVDDPLGLAEAHIASERERAMATLHVGVLGTVIVGTAVNLVLLVVATRTGEADRAIKRD